MSGNSEGNPATLVAIVIAARRAKNRELEREMRRRLQTEFGVKISFAKEMLEAQEGAQ